MPQLLVIEDNYLICEMLQRALEQDGYEVRTAEDGEKGLRLFRQQAADLVVIDLFMPNKDEFETIIELRQTFPGVKIIGISGAAKSHLNTAQKRAPIGRSPNRQTNASFWMPSVNFWFSSLWITSSVCPRMWPATSSGEAPELGAATSAVGKDEIKFPPSRVAFPQPKSTFGMSALSPQRLARGKTPLPLVQLLVLDPTKSMRSSQMYMDDICCSACCVWPHKIQHFPRPAILERDLIIETDRTRAVA